LFDRHEVILADLARAIFLEFSRSMRFLINIKLGRLSGSRGSSDSSTLRAKILESSLGSEYVEIAKVGFVCRGLTAREDAKAISLGNLLQLHLASFNDIWLATRNCFHLTRHQDQPRRAGESARSITFGRFGTHDQATEFLLVARRDWP
jgi:hypothetical protein